MKKLAIPEIKISFKHNETVDKIKIKHSQNCYDAMKDMFDLDTFEYLEECIALFLNNNNETIGWFRLSFGGLSGTIVDQRLLYTVALKSGATSVVLAHNHPSGRLVFSEEDIKMSKECKEAGKILGITFLDSLVITKKGYISMSEENLF